MLLDSKFQIRASVACKIINSFLDFFVKIWFYLNFSQLIIKLMVPIFKTVKVGLTTFKIEIVFLFNSSDFFPKLIEILTR